MLQFNLEIFYNSLIVMGLLLQFLFKRFDQIFLIDLPLHQSYFLLFDCSPFSDLPK